jgi:hypothetical protein
MKNPLNLLLIENLLKYFLKPGCPIGVVQHESLFNCFNDLQNKISNSSYSDEIISQNHLFFSSHFQMFYKIASLKTVTIFLKYIFEKLSNNYFINTPDTKCIDCEFTKTREIKIKECFSENIYDSEFKNKYSNSEGLCYLYLNKVLNLTNNPGLFHYLSEIHESRIKKHLNEINSFLNQ